MLSLHAKNSSYGIYMKSQGQQLLDLVWKVPNAETAAHKQYLAQSLWVRTLAKPYPDLFYAIKFYLR